MWNYYYTPYSDELYHYGILGMKWGIRKERQSSGTGRGRGRGRKKLTDKQKKMIRNIAIGAGAAGLATGGAILFAKSGGFKGIKNRVNLKNAYRGMTNNQAMDALEGMRYQNDAKRSLRSWLDLKAATKGAKLGARDAIKIGDRRLHYNAGAHAISNVKKAVKGAGNAVKSEAKRRAYLTREMVRDQNNFVRTHPKTTAARILGTAGITTGIYSGVTGVQKLRDRKRKRN